MVWRSRVIFTRSSRAASSAGDGARTWTAAAGCATGVGAAAARSIAASMSPLVTRPSLPVPATVAASTPLSAASLRTDGGSGIVGAAFGRSASAARAARLCLGRVDRRRRAGFWSGRPVGAAGLAAARCPRLP